PSTRATPSFPTRRSSDLRTEDVAAWIIGWRLSVEPDPYGIWHTASIPDAAKRTTGYNFGSFSSPDVDRAIDAARTPAGGDCSQPDRKSTRLNSSHSQISY